jgi:hypothetical protein
MLRWRQQTLRALELVVQAGDAERGELLVGEAVPR